MSLAQLLGIPPTQQGMDEFSWAHYQHHYADINLELRQIGKPIPTNDLWIAALCRHHSLPILSNDRHFDFVPGNKRIEW